MNDQYPRPVSMAVAKGLFDEEKISRKQYDYLTEHRIQLLPFEVALVNNGMCMWYVVAVRYTDYYYGCGRDYITAVHVLRIGELEGSMTCVAELADCTEHSRGLVKQTWAELADCEDCGNGPGLPERNLDILSSCQKGIERVRHEIRKVQYKVNRLEYHTCFEPVLQPITRISTINPTAPLPNASLVQRSEWQTPVKVRRVASHVPAAFPCMNRSCGRFSVLSEVNDSEEQ
jgi:hypothetical protein